MAIKQWGWVSHSDATISWGITCDVGDVTVQEQCEESCDNVTGTESNTVCRKLRYLIPTDDERSISFKRFYFCLLKIFLLIFSNALLYVFCTLLTSKWRGECCWESVIRALCGL